MIFFRANPTLVTVISVRCYSSTLFFQLVHGVCWVHEKEGGGVPKKAHGKLYSSRPTVVQT